jgi:hypothetical protein
LVSPRDDSPCSGTNRQQFHRGDADPLEVLDHRRVGDSGVGAALAQRHLGVAEGQAPDVRLVDHGVVVRDMRGPVVAPVEERVDDHVLRHEGGAVGRVRPPRVGPLVVEQGLVPLHVPVERLAVRVEQQLGRRAAGAVPGGVRAVHPVAVPLPGADRGQVAMPDEPVDLGQLDPGLVPGIVEQA